MKIFIISKVEFNKNIDQDLVQKVNNKKITSVY